MNNDEYRIVLNGEALHSARRGWHDAASMRTLTSMIVLAGVLGGFVDDAGAREPSARTPSGPATLVQVDHRPVTAEGRAPEVLVAWRLDVGAGGHGGAVRLRVKSPLDRRAGTVVGDWVRLSGHAGRFTFPAPHLFWDSRVGTVALDQRSGGLAIMERFPCRPFATNSDADPCRLLSVAALAPLARDQPLPSAPQARLRGRRLAITPIVEYDLDRDRAGDLTEDRTDLAVSTTVTASGPERTLVITVRNGGPRTADLPLVRIAGPAVTAWAPACAPPPPWGPGRWPDPSACALAPLKAGATAELRATLPAEAAGTATVTVAAEGPDLAPGDNAAAAELPS